MQDELRKAQEHYSKIEESGPPPFAEPMPQLVVWSEGTAIYRVTGVRSVSDALHSISREEFVFELNTEE
jgi:hypothetical protein